MLVRGPSGLALPTGEKLVQTRVDSAQARWGGHGSRLGTPVASCRSLSVTLLKCLGVTFTSGELGGGERTLGVQVCRKMWRRNVATRSSEPLVFLLSFDCVVRIRLLTNLEITL